MGTGPQEVFDAALDADLSGDVVGATLCYEQAAGEYVDAGDPGSAAVCKDLIEIVQGN